MKWLCFLMLLFTPVFADARDAARDLRRMVGFTIIKADSISEVLEKRSGGVILELTDGSRWAVDFMTLPPLTMTDVIVFARKLPADLLAKLPANAPDILSYEIKFLVDNEAYDARPAR